MLTGQHESEASQATLGSQGAGHEQVESHWTSRGAGHLAGRGLLRTARALCCVWWQERQSVAVTGMASGRAGLRPSPRREAGVFSPYSSSRRGVLDRCPLWTQMLGGDGGQAGLGVSHGAGARARGRLDTAGGHG